MTDFTAITRGRFPTGVAGLDTMLHGGLLPQGVYVLLGPSGAGKTTLANQIAFFHAATATIRYVTVLAETHTRLIGQIRQFAFFDPILLRDRLTYLSAYEAFQEGSYTGLSTFLLPIIRQDTPALLILDGLPLTTPGMPDDPTLNTLLTDLQVASEFGRCTTLILSLASTGVWENRAFMLVDGAFELTRRLTRTGLERSIQTHVFRGGSHQPGIASMTMDARGITVLPPDSLPLDQAADSAPA
jgi:circadian clock protein KaiC